MGAYLHCRNLGFEVDYQNETGKVIPLNKSRRSSSKIPFSSFLLVVWHIFVLTTMAEMAVYLIVLESSPYLGIDSYST